MSVTRLMLAVLKVDAYKCTTVICSRQWRVWAIANMQNWWTQNWWTRNWNYFTITSSGEHRNNRDAAHLKRYKYHSKFNKHVDNKRIPKLSNQVPQLLLTLFCVLGFCHCYRSSDAITALVAVVLFLFFLYHMLSSTGFSGTCVLDSTCAPSCDSP